MAPHHHWKASAKIRLMMSTKLSVLLEADFAALATCTRLLLHHIRFSVVYDFVKAECLGSGFPCWMYPFKLNCFLLFLFHPPIYFSHLSWPDKHLKQEKPHSPHFSGLGLSNTEESVSISIATQKELNHLENVRKEVLGEAKNHNQVSLAYKLCSKSQAFCSSLSLAVGLVI